MADVHLRLAEPHDFDAIASLTSHYIRTTTIHFATEPVTGAELRALWREHEALYPWVVAEVAGEVVAYAKAGVWRTRAAYRWTPETGVYVRDDQRGHGLGRVVYERLIALCRAQGFHSLIAVATLPNPASARLHEDLGFVLTGTISRAGFKFGAWWDVAVWQLMLASGETSAGSLRTPQEAW